MDLEFEILEEDKFVYIFKHFVHDFYRKNLFHRISNFDFNKIIQNQIFFDFFEDRLVKFGIPNYFDYLKLNSNEL